MNALGSKLGPLFDHTKLDLGGRRRDVLAVIQRFPEGIGSNRVAKILNLPLNEVSGRITELHKAACIKRVGVEKSDRGKPNHTYVATASYRK